MLGLDVSISDFFVDVETLPEGTPGFCQLLFLLAVYGFVLFKASNLISDGSELLLLVPSVAGIVGPICLPVLGAVPDAAIILFSGLGPDAQEQLDVGAGALVGSTVMLLTLPWFLSVFAGRVNIEEGGAVYKRPHGVSAHEWSKLTPPGRVSLLHTGVSGSSQLKQGGSLILITAVTYVIIQGPACALDGKSLEEVSRGESLFALAGLVVASIFLLGYLYVQWKASQREDDVMEDFLEEVRKKKILRGEISLMGCMSEELRALKKVGGEKRGYQALSSHLEDTRAMKRLSALLRPFFTRYDLDGNDSLSLQELSSVFSDLHDYIPAKDLQDHFRAFDRDGSGAVSFEEFTAGVAELAITNHERFAPSLDPRTSTLDAVDENDEHEEVPEDLLDLPPDQQQLHIKFRAATMLISGTALVLIFSDPMVEVLSMLGDRLGVSAFYVSFLLAPLASNASELIASVAYASKKTSKTITISLSALQGACCLNNTLGLGVFLFLIYFRNLAWEFSAETSAVLFVEVVMAFMSFRNTHRLLDALVVLSLYPLSLVIVAYLESIGWD